MKFTDRWGEDWQEYRCSDCDPDIADDVGEECEYEQPYVMLVPESEVVPDNCPRCGSYLSLLDGASKLHIVNTPVQRWLEKQNLSSQS